MRSGDFILSPTGQQWVIAYITRHFENMIGGAPGKYVFLTRALDGPEGTDVIYCLKHEDDVLMLWQGATEFDTGDVYTVEGEPLALHREGRSDFLPMDDALNAVLRGLNAPVVSMRDDSGKFTPLWRWELAMIMMRGSRAPISFLCADFREATEAEF